MNGCMIYATFASGEEARTVGKTLVSEKLVACVNVIDGVTSIYEWDGETAIDSESVMIAKTCMDRRDVAMARIENLHPYETPCVVAYDIAAGLPGYMAWLASETSAR